MLKTASSVTNAVGALNYKGSWNASTNVPTLVSGVGNKGDYYVVSVAGNTNLDGQTLWSVGDIAAFNGTIWQKIEGGDVGLFSSLTVTTLNGYMYGNGSNVVTASATIPVANVTGAVANTTTINAGGLLSGGGNLASNVTITLSNVPVANVPGAVPNTVNVLAGGLLTGGGALTGNVTLSLTSVPFANVTGYGTMATQNSNAVTITGGTVDNVTIGGTTAAAGTFTTMTANSTAQFGRASANYAQIVGSATGNAVIFSTLGSDANVSVAIQPKGTGAIDLAAGSSGVNISNGGTVTAITGTAGGSYTTVPTITISAPTTAGGTQATGTVGMAGLTISLASGGSGYSIGDTITLTGGTFTQAILLTVATLSGSAVATFTTSNFGTYSVLATNPISQGSSSGAGTGATFNVTAWQVRSTAYTITGAGSGYVEQPTVTFSSGSATAYATVGSTPVIRSLGQNLDFYTPNNTSTPSFRVFDNQSAGTGQFISVRSSSTIPLLLSSAALNISSTSTNNVSIFTNANSQEQMRVSHTASAVNYVQVTGAATGGTPAISAQGSDAAVSLNLISKSTGVIRFYTATASSEQFRVTHTAGTIVNYATATGAISGAGPIFSVAGTDADIDLNLTPKGAGAVRFGTYTVSALLAVAGYITIKDSGGTTRRLLVG